MRVVDYGIRGMHLAYDLLDGYRALVIIDLIPRGQPGEIQVLQVDRDDLAGGSFDAHGMDPVAVLGTLEALGGQLPPTYVIGCPPSTVDEGLGLSAPVAAAVTGAITALEQLLAGAAGAGRLRPGSECRFLLRGHGAGRRVPARSSMPWPASSAWPARCATPPTACRSRSRAHRPR